LLIGAIVGFIWGSYFQPTCPIDSDTGQITDCMGDPGTYKAIGSITGTIVGVIIGLIVSFFVKSKK